MKITSKELVSSTRGKVKDFICEEVLSSLTAETIHAPVITDDEGYANEVGVDR
jgi:hypothetical protein